MQRLIDFVVRFKEYFTLLALVIISLSLVSMGDVSKMGGARAVMIGVIGQLQSLFSFVPNTRALEVENKAIRELNLQLSTEVTRMRKSLLENEQLRRMLELKQKSSYPLIAAEVVGLSSVEMRHYATINRGYGSGIDFGMTVRTDAGLVGNIVGQTENYSLVELMNNRNVKIAAKFVRTGINGIIVWEGGEFLKVKNIPESFDVKVGDELITSNFSNKYPDEIPIGKVAKVEHAQGSLFKRITVIPHVNFSAISEVFVIKFISDPERNRLLKEMEERLQAKRGF